MLFPRSSESRRVFPAGGAREVILILASRHQGLDCDRSACSFAILNKIWYAGLAA